MLCGECGFDVEAALGTSIEFLGAVGPRIRPFSVETAELRTSRGGWSVVEYVCHVRDALGFYRMRIEVIPWVLSQSQVSQRHTCSGTVRPFTRRQVIVERDAISLEHGGKPFPNPISPTLVDHPDRRLAVFGPHRDVGHLFGIVGKESAACRTSGQQAADLRATYLPFGHVHTGNVRHWEAVGEPQSTVADVSVFDPEVLSVTTQGPVAPAILAMDRKDELHAARRDPL